MKNREALMKFISTQGYKRNSPDVNNPVNVIPTGNITMQDVDFPVRGVDNLGNEIIMQPGQDYHFPGQYVVETPMAQQGGTYNPFDTAGYRAGDTTTDVTSRHRLENLDNNRFNKFLVGASNLSDPRNMAWALPNRGFFGKVKAVAGAASGISGAALGYEKLFAPDKTQSHINNYDTGEHGTTNDVLGNRRLNQWGRKEMYQESPVDENARRRFTTHGSDLYPVQNGVAERGGTMRKYQPGGYVPDFQKWYLDNLSRPDIVANVQNQEELVNIYNKDMNKSGTPATQTQVTSPGVNSLKFNQYPVSTVHGDSAGITAANNAIMGFGMVNQVLGEQDLEKEYNKRLRELGNTDARYNASNAVNPFGDYTLNAGPASNFALVANTPIQDFGTRRASAKRGGTVYEEGGEYYATKDDIKNILAAGGEIEYLD